MRMHSVLRLSVEMTESHWPMEGYFCHSILQMLCSFNSLLLLHHLCSYFLFFPSSSILPCGKAGVGYMDWMSGLGLYFVVCRLSSLSLSSICHTQ